MFFGFFGALKRLTASITRTAELFDEANRQLADRLAPPAPAELPDGREVKGEGNGRARARAKGE